MIKLTLKHWLLNFAVFLIALLIIIYAANSKIFIWSLVFWFYLQNSILFILGVSAYQIGAKIQNQDANDGMDLGQLFGQDKRKVRSISRYGAIFSIFGIILMIISAGLLIKSILSL